MTDTTRDLIQRMARELDLYRQMARDDCTSTHPFADEARAFLAQPQPEGPTLDCDDIDVPAWHRGYAFHVYKEGYASGWSNAVIAADRTRWGRPAVEPVPEGKWYPRFADWLEREMPEGTVIGDPLWWASKIADYVARWGRPAVEPVPVSKRLPREGDCDANGHCWCGTRASIDRTGDLPVEMPSSWELREPCAQDDCVLPHHALPIPTTPTETNGQA